MILKAGKNSGDDERVVEIWAEQEDYGDIVIRMKDSGSKALETLAAERDEAVAELEKLREQIKEYEDQEAAVCPENYGFAEVIVDLRGVVEHRDNLIEACLPFVSKCVDPMRCGTDTHTMCARRWGLCPACFVRSHIEGALEGGDGPPFTKSDVSDVQRDMRYGHSEAARKDQDDE